MPSEDEIRFVGIERVLDAVLHIREDGRACLVPGIRMLVLGVGGTAMQSFWSRENLSQLVEHINGALMDG